MTRRHRAGAGALLILGLAAFGACNGDGGDTGAGGDGAASSTSAPSEERTTSSAPGASTSTTAAGNVITVTVSGGKVEGGFRREKVPLKEPIVLRVMSDSADEVHVHGYNIKVDVAAGGTADISFTPDIPGVFEVELEQRSLRIAELAVGS